MIEKSDLRELVFRLEHARKSLIGPKFRALGLPLGQGQPRILNSLLKKQHVTQKSWPTAALWTPPPFPVFWTG